MRLNNNIPLMVQREFLPTISNLLVKSKVITQVRPLNPRGAPFWFPLRGNREGGGVERWAINLVL
jgi:hypothetical protein